MAINIKILPDVEILKQLVYIDYTIPEGLRWKNNRQRCAKDSPTGYKTHNNYYQTKLNYIRYFNHRIIFSIANNINLTETQTIDHIDRNPQNNHPNNLRIASHAENMRNVTKRQNTASKFIGVVWSKNDKKWQAQIQVNNQRKYLGQFLTEIEAATAYNNYIISNNLTHFNLNKI